MRCRILVNFALLTYNYHIFYVFLLAFLLLLLLMERQRKWLATLERAYSCLIYILYFLFILKVADSPKIKFSEDLVTVYEFYINYEYGEQVCKYGKYFK